MKQGLVRLLYNLGKVHGVDITHDNVCSSMLSCFYSHLLSTGRAISSFTLFHLISEYQICVINDMKCSPLKIEYCNCIHYNIYWNFSGIAPLTAPPS